MKNTVQTLELNNGEVIELTLTFARLLKVKNHNKKLYGEFMNSLKNKDFDIFFDSAKIIYVAYLCGLNDNMNNANNNYEPPKMSVPTVNIPINNASTAAISVIINITFFIYFYLLSTLKF